MNEKKTYKKALPAVALVLALLCLAGTALGAWYARSQTTNKITTGSLKGLLIDEYEQDTVLNPGLTADKVVKVENTGEITSVVRIRVEKAWGSSRDENQVLQSTAEDRQLSTDNILISYNTSDWYYDSDGDWYYYKEVLEPEDVSEPLFTEFTIDPATTNAYKNKYADIKVTMECIQAGGNALEEYWKQDFTELGIDYDSTRRVIRTYVEFTDPDGGEEAFLFKTEADDGDLFAMFKDLVPGEARSQEVEVSNTWEEDVYLYFRALLTEQEQAAPETEALIEKMLKEYVTITVTEQNSGSELYRGPVWGNLVEQASGTDTMKDLIPLGSFAPRESRDLLVSLYADPSMDNEYQDLEGWIDWEFVALDDIVPEKPEKTIKTGDLNEEGEGRPGSLLTYEITYFNHEAETAEVTVVDELDDQVKYIRASDPGIYKEEGHTVTWKIPNVPPRTEGSVEVTVEILPGAMEEGSVANQAGVKIGSNHSVDTNIVTTDIEEPDEPKDPRKEVAVSSQVGADEAAYPGQQITYNIWYYNHEILPARVQIWDELDDHVEFVSASHGGTHKSGTVTWTIADAASKQWDYVTVTVKVLESAVKEGAVENQAEAQIEGNSRYKTNVIEHDVEEPPVDPVDPGKVMAPDSARKAEEKVKTGDILTYRISYYNHYKTPADVTITDKLDDGVNFKTASDGGTYDADTHTVTWILKNTPSRVFQSVTLSVEVNEDAVTKVDNQAVVQLGNDEKKYTDIVTNPVEDPTDPGEPEEPDDPENPKKETAPDSQVKDGDTAYPGQTITYNIWYYNHEIEAAEVQIRDELDENVEFVSASHDGVHKSGTVTWTIAGAASRQWDYVTVTVKVLESAVEEGTVENQAEVQIEGNSSYKTNMVDHDVEEPPTEPVDPEKMMAPDSSKKAEEKVKAGDILTYQISYYNHYKDPSDVTITDKLDDGVNFKTASDGGTYDADTHTVTWILKNTPSRVFQSVTLSVEVNEDAVTNVDNQAVVQIGKDAEKYTDIVTNPVEEPTDPGKPEEPDDPENPIKETARDSQVKDGATAYPGQTLTYNIWYYNHEIEAAEVQIRDELDAHVEYVSASHGGTYKSGTVTWTITDAASKQWNYVTITVKVLESAVEEGAVENQAEVQIEGNSSYKTNVVDHDVDEPSTEPVDPEKFMTPDSDKKADEKVTAEDVLTYQISYYNHYGDPVDVTITDKLDDGVDFKSASDGGIYDADTHTVTWSLKNVPSRVFQSVTLTVEVNEDAVTKVENQAVVQIGKDTEKYTDIVTNPLEESTDPEEPDDPEKPIKETAQDSHIKDGAAAYPGQMITYNIWYYNHEIEAAEVQIQDELDKNVEFVSASHGGTHKSGTVTWTITEAASKQWDYVTVTVKVLGSAVEEGVVENQAEVQIDRNSSYKTNVIDHDVEEPPTEPVDPEKFMAPDSNKKVDEKVKTGDILTYQISYYNHYKDPADVTITDKLDDGVDFKAASSGGVYDADTHTVIWTLKNMPSRVFQSVTLSVEVNEEAVTRVDNQAFVQIGNDTGKNTDTVTNPIEDPDSKQTDKQNPSVGTGSRARGFKKTPVTDEALPGGTIDYIFSDFDNELSRSMKRYSITDIFPEGLYFTSASIPAFVKGEGLTYDVNYITNQQERRDLYTGIPADQDFTFNSPKLNEGEWIMYLTIEFEEVPSGFGEGDTILFTCRVAEDVKEGATLVNEAALGYDGLGISGQTKGVKINGTGGSGRSVKTGDSTQIIILFISSLLSIGVLGIIGIYKKKNN